MNKVLVTGISSALLVSQMAVAQVTRVKMPSATPVTESAASTSGFLNLTQPGRIRGEVTPKMKSGRYIIPTSSPGASNIAAETKTQALALSLATSLTRATP